jgi:hypothetical protein
MKVCIMSYTGIYPVDFVLNSCVNLLNILGSSTGLGFWPTTAFTVCVAWPAASFVLLKTVFREKVDNAPGRNA